MVHGTISRSERHARSEVRMIQSPPYGYSPSVPGCGYRYSRLQHPNRHNRYTHPSKAIDTSESLEPAQRGQQSASLSCRTHVHCCRWQVVQNQLMYCWLLEFERIIYRIVGCRVSWQSHEYAILGDSENSFLTLCCQIIRVLVELLLYTKNGRKLDLEFL